MQFGKRLEVGSSMNLKNTSRINLWDKNGKIIIGDFFSMGYNSELYSWNEIQKIGNNTSINDNCKIYGNVTIGDNCLLASNIYISSGSHNFTSMPQLPIKEQDKLASISKAIVIEDDVWIGFGVVIMPGMYIGKGAIIGSNAVVTKNVFPYTIVAGVPAKEIGKRLEFHKQLTELNSYDIEHWPFFYKGFEHSQFKKESEPSVGIKLNSTGVVLLNKQDITALYLAGVSSISCKLDVFVDQEYTEQLYINAGVFEETIHFSKKARFESPEFVKLSPEIREKFSVVVIKIQPGEKKSSGNILQIKSISIA